MFTGTTGCISGGGGLSSFCLFISCRSGFTHISHQAHELLLQQQLYKVQNTKDFCFCNIYFSPHISQLSFHPFAASFSKERREGVVFFARFDTVHLLHFTDILLVKAKQASSAISYNSSTCHRLQVMSSCIT
jgi:hypothetical protein